MEQFWESSIEIACPFGNAPDHRNHLISVLTHQNNKMSSYLRLQQPTVHNCALPVTASPPSMLGQSDHLHTWSPRWVARGRPSPRDGFGCSGWASGRVRRTDKAFIDSRHMAVQNVCEGRSHRDIVRNLRRYSTWFNAAPSS